MGGCIFVTITMFALCAAHLRRPALRSYSCCFSSQSLALAQRSQVVPPFPAASLSLFNAGTLPDGMENSLPKTSFDLELPISHELSVPGIHDPLAVGIMEGSYECANRAPLARLPKPANRGSRPRCVVMRKMRMRKKT